MMFVPTFGFIGSNLQNLQENDLEVGWSRVAQLEDF